MPELTENHIRVSVEPLVLALASPFRIAHGTSTERRNALVRIGASFGEAALPPYYETRVADVEEYVQSLDFAFLSDLDEMAIEKILSDLPPGPAPAVAAVDMALYDIWGKGLNQPLYRLFGFARSSPLTSTYALSIPQNETEWKETLSAVSEYPALKLKLGSGDLEYDEGIVRIAREMYAGDLCVDANSAWTIPEAVKIIPRLTQYDLQFVEQPISFDELDDWHLLRRMLPNPGVPLIADESVRTTDDVIALAGAADGVNLKLAKCGGIRKVKELISLARALDMSVMLGCMIESSLALTAAAHLAPLADFLDLDATLHLANDPFSGLRFELGRIHLPQEPGLGVSENSWIVQGPVNAPDPHSPSEASSE